MYLYRLPFRKKKKKKKKKTISDLLIKTQDIVFICHYHDLLLSRNDLSLTFPVLTSQLNNSGKFQIPPVSIMRLICMYCYG